MAYVSLVVAPNMSAYGMASFTLRAKGSNSSRRAGSSKGGGSSSPVGVLFFVLFLRLLNCKRAGGRGVALW